MPAAREGCIIAAFNVIATATSAALLAEVIDRLEKELESAAVLLSAEAIDDLAERRGAVTKGSTDAERVMIERQAKQVRVAQLKEDSSLPELRSLPD